MRAGSNSPNTNCNNSKSFASTLRSRDCLRMSDCTVWSNFSTSPMLLKFLQGTKFNCEEAYTELVKQLKRLDEEPPVRMTPQLSTALVRPRTSLGFGIHARVRPRQVLQARSLRPAKARCDLHHAGGTVQGYVHHAHGTHTALHDSGREVGEHGGCHRPGRTRLDLPPLQCSPLCLRYRH